MSQDAKARMERNGANAPGGRASAGAAGTGLDGRLLSHHPAGQSCLEVCKANGWMPESADVVRLVKLWSEVRDGLHSEVELSKPRLHFARWLKSHGRINEGLDAAA